MTLKELAHILNLSPTTVSRALMGYSDVSEKTRKRVLKAAARHHYTPNTNAQRLKKGKSDVIGLLLPSQPGAFEEPFFLKLIAGVGEYLVEQGLDLLLTSGNRQVSDMELVEKMVHSRRVDGIILSRPKFLDERVEFMQEQGFPFVCHGRTQFSRPHAFLDVDGERAFRQACQRLLDFGHRRIALLNAKPEFMFAQHRFLGYKRALENAGIALDSHLVCEGHLTEEFGFAASQHLMQQAHPPTAFLCATDRIALGVLRGVQFLGLRAGSDVSVIGYDDLPIASHSIPPLTTMHQPIQESGRRVAEMLVSLIGGTPSEELQEVWQATLVARESDGPVRS